MAEMKIVSGRNQKAIMESMISMIKERAGDRYNDMTENDIIYIITEAFSHGISQLAFYHDRAILELNPKTVQTEMGKANLISSNGGTLEFFRGNYGYIKAYVKSGTPNNTLIPKYTKVIIDGENYYTENDFIYNTGNVSYDGIGAYMKLPIRQGKLKNVQYSKANVSRDKLLIKDADSENEGVCFESISVSNQGNWERVEDVFFNFVNVRVGGSLKVFSIDKSTDRKPIIALMKGWETQISKYASNVFTVTYAITGGDLVQSVPVNTECTINSEFIDRSETLTEIRGGKAPDFNLDVQLEKSIRESRTMWTAVTKDDFDILSRENDDVLSSITYDINSDNISEINAHLIKNKLDAVKPLEILISLIDYNSRIPNSKLVDDVMSLLDKRKLSIFTLRYIPPELIKVDYKVVVKTIGESFVLNNNEVESIISELYNSTINFGRNNVTDSGVISRIHSLSKSVHEVSVVKTTSSNINPFSYFTLGTVSVSVEVI